MAVDPATGDVRALVGGRNYAEAPFNRATQALRQPGSSFKPFVYARALADSLPPNAIVYDTALTITYDRQSYRPKNSDGEFLGPLTLREALARSRNPVAVQLWQREGADSVIALARRAGLSTSIAPYPSSAIGASVVRPLDFVAAYTTFARLGAPEQVVMGPVLAFGTRLVTFFLLISIFFTLYKSLPYRRVRWQQALAGALTSGVLFEVARWAFTWVVHRFNPATLYTGALAAIVIVVFWVYYGALIVIIGGEVSQVREDRITEASEFA